LKEPSYDSRAKARGAQIQDGLMNIDAIEESLQQFENISKSSMSPLLLRRKNNQAGSTTNLASPENKNSQ